MSAIRLRFSAPSSNVIVHNSHRDNRIFWREASIEKTIQLAQRAPLLSIAVTHGVLLSEEPYQFWGHRRDEFGGGTCWQGVHRITSSAEMATLRKPATSTRV